MEERRKRCPVILGLMRMNEVPVEQLEDLLRYALDNDVWMIDAADVYSRGRAERVLGEVFRRNPGMRERFFIQTKVGIVKEEGHQGYYDFSYDHIVKGTTASLERLGLDYVDSLLLHRPDIFMDSEEVSRAIDTLKEKGRIRRFGVSNMDVSQMEYLQDALDLPIEVDQLQLGLGQLALVSSTFNVNNPKQERKDTDGLYFYLKRRKIYLQCWSPYQYGLFEGSIFRHPAMARTNELLKELSAKYGHSPCAIATSFLLSLGPNVEVVVGGLKKEYLAQSLEGRTFLLDKEDWYKLYVSTGNMLP